MKLRTAKLRPNAEVAEIPRRLRSLDRQGDDAFLVLLHDPAMHHPERPLIVVVHPGDMVEVRQGWAPHDWVEVFERSLEFQQGAARDIARWMADGADVVLLHRGSCAQIEAHTRHTCANAFAEAIGLARRAGTTLYGDHLEEAGDWMLKHLHIVSRPALYLAGAYADAKHGCLTAIGQILENAARGRVIVSDYAYVSSGSERWSPAQHA